MSTTIEAVDAVQLNAANERFAARHRGSFEGDMVACRAALLRAAHGLCRNQDDADDTLQSTFLRALERRDKFLGGSMMGWLYRIMLNIFRDQRKARARFVFIDDLANEDRTPVDNTPDPANPHRSLEVQEILEATAARPDADVLVQAGLGASNEELAAQFSMSAANVRQTLSRGRRALREFAELR